MYVCTCPLYFKSLHHYRKSTGTENEDFYTGNPVEIIYFADCLLFCLHAGELESSVAA